MLGFGALGEFPLADFGTPPAPTSVSLPAVAFTVSITATGARGGRNIGLAAVGFEFASPALAARAGKQIGLPAPNIAFFHTKIGVLAGRSLGLPKAAVVFKFGPIRPQTGRIFNLANTVVRSSDAGAFGEGALAEFAIGEGGVIEQEYSLPVQFRFAAFAAGLQAGRNIDLTAPDISFTSPVPEIDARRRKLRVLAIAS